MDTNPKEKSWVPFPVPTDQRGLTDLCKWLNYMDGVMTTYNLTTGVYTEWNPIMRRAWDTSPIVYATLKWWLFWLGLRLLEKSILTDSPRDDRDTQKHLLKLVLGVFSILLGWHVLLILQFYR